VSTATGEQVAEAGGNRLPVLAGEIRKAHTSAREHQRKTLEQAIRAGELLNEAKWLVGHGKWSTWLKEHCDMSDRTARLYMRFARNKHALETEIGNVADLGIRGAIESLAGPERLPRAVYKIGWRDRGDGYSDQIWIVGSCQHPGHCYVTHLLDSPDGSAEACGLTRPIARDFVDAVVEYLLPNVALTWEEQDAPPWAYNMWLLDEPYAPAAPAEPPQMGEAAPTKRGL
jgi:hypothetical protein